MTDKIEPASTEIEVVYIGQRSAATPGKALGGFITPARLEATGRGNADKRASFYDAGRGGFGRLVLGGVYETTGVLSEDGSVARMNLEKLKFLRRVEADEEVAEWELIDEAVRLNVRAESQARKLKDDPAFASTLRPLRIMYLAASPSIRPALELAILKAVRGVS